MAYEGLNSIPDRKAAFELFSKAADAGHHAALGAKGLLKYRGQGTTADRGEGERMVKEALAGLLESAHQGEPFSQNLLGSLYSLGIGVAKDASASQEWYEKAANGGSAVAMHNLGIVYQQRAQSESDPSQAFEWFKKAAELGFAKAMYELGGCYVTGIGVDQSDENAFDGTQRGLSKEVSRHE